MISMTGYGKGEGEQGGLRVTMEIKSVNHRYADVTVKLPRTFLGYENDLKKRVGSQVKRGKVDVYVNYEMSGEVLATPQVNAPLATKYRDLFRALQQDLGLDGAVSLELVAAQKDVIQVTDADLDADLLRSTLLAAADAALAQLLTMRRAEGAETARDIAARLDAAAELLDQVAERAPAVPEEWRDKLQERLERLGQEVEWDPQRVAQEIAVFADRCDISEELARFRSHVGQFRDLLADPEPVGRRMDFLVQELNREVNTMGSKSNDAELTRLVVALKSELEKVREQVQNVE